jgi:DNA repair photolyase
MDFDPRAQIGNSSLPKNVIPLRTFFLPNADQAANRDEETRNPFDGVLSAAMWEKANRVPSAYEDRFDYSMYDKLYARFGNAQPRGGVVFKGSLKLLEAKDCTNCFHRFEIDTYGRGCVHNCSYCYAKSFLSIRKMWNEPMPFPIDIAEIRKIFATVFETDRKHKYRSILQKRIPLRIGSMSDSFMWLDKKYRVTYELLKLLKFYDYPYLIFTRSDLVADDEYMSVLDKDLASIQMSVSSINEEMTRVIEPGAPSPMRRLKALSKLAKHGFWTTVRINPLFPIYPDGYYTNPSFDHSKATKPFEYFSWDIVKVIAEHGIPSMLAGVVRLYQPNIRFMNAALGWDIRDTFATSDKFQRDYIEFSVSEANYYYKKLQNLSHQHGVRFSTCYIGGDTEGHGFEFNRPLWSNQSDCCDAKGNVRGIVSTCADIAESDKPTPGLTRKLSIPIESTTKIETNK